MAIQQISTDYIVNQGCWTPVQTALNKINEIIIAIEGGTGSDIVANSVTTSSIIRTPSTGGISIDGILFNTSLDASNIVTKTGIQTITGQKAFTNGLLTTTIVLTDLTELTANQGIRMDKAIVRYNTATAINSTGTATAFQINGGLLTSTSAAPTTITLDTATNLATQLGATKGTIFDFVVDNSAGANTVTIAVGSGIVASGFPATNTLTLANSTTVGIATFRLVFISTTAATLARIS